MSVNSRDETVLDQCFPGAPAAVVPIIAPRLVNGTYMRYGLDPVFREERGHRRDESDKDMERASKEFT